MENETILTNEPIYVATICLDYEAKLRELAGQKSAFDEHYKALSKKYNLEREKWYQTRERGVTEVVFRNGEFMDCETGTVINDLQTLEQVSESQKQLTFSFEEYAQIQV